MNEFTNNLLAMIYEASDGIIDFILTPPGQLRINKIPRTTYYSALNRLEQKGLIQKKKKAYRNLYFLTEKGKKLIRNPITKKQRTDGFSTIIIFDIPEEKARERTIFRRYLKNNGYTILQKSVLIAPFELSNDIKELIEELKIRNNISVIDGKIKYF